jgi:hypothetical protein
VRDKKDVTTAKNMEEQSIRFLGQSETAMSHSFVADRAATGIAAILDDKYRAPPPLGYTGHHQNLKNDPCSGHDSSKVIGFMTGKCGHKDGKGGDLWVMDELVQFNADFSSLELEFRQKDFARLLAEASASMGKGQSATVAFKSNFNTTRMSGDTGQHEVAVRTRKAMLLVDAANGTITKHTFRGKRWIELVQIMALEAIAGNPTLTSAAIFQSCPSGT